MKRAIAILFILFLLPLVFAVEVDMETEFNEGQTLIAKISGTFTQTLSENNIFFYRGHTRMPMDFEFGKINDDFYLYAQLLGRNPDNYSIKIEGAKYIKAGQVSEEDIVKEFSIKPEMAGFSVEPGFVIAEEDFFIEAQNLQDSSITINIVIDKIEEETEEQGFFESLFGGGDDEEEDVVRSVTLKSGETKKITFSTSNMSNITFQNIELTSGNLTYNIPAYITITIDEEESEEIQSFVLEPSDLNISMSTESTTSRIIYLYNDGTADLENITISVSNALEQYISLSEEYIEELEPNSSIKIILNFSSDDREKWIEGQITAQADEEIYEYLAIFLRFLEDYQPLPGEQEQYEITDPAIKTCAQMQGVICESGEGCQGETKHAREGDCCLGECLEIEDDDGWKILGWVIIIVIALFLYWFFKRKYRGVRRETNLLKIAKRRKK